VAALGQSGDPRAVEPLIVVLQHNRLDISAQTVVPKIPLRAAAATALGQLGDSRAVEPLIAVLQNKGAPTVSIFMMPVRAAAASALGQLGDARAIEPLTAALEHKPLTPALQRSYEEVRTAATTALEKLGQKQAAMPAPQEDPVQKLKELKESLDAGLITAQEYEAKKADILSKM
jgi:HEAT repeat protein